MQKNPQIVETPDCVKFMHAFSSEEEEQIRRNMREPLWKAICPEKYQEPFDFSKVSAQAHKEGLKRVLGWAYNPRGLWIGGDTGRSKSRCAYEALKAFYLAGKTVLLIDGPIFGELCGEKNKENQMSRWLAKEFSAPDIVYIDDWGKFRTETESLGVGTHYLLELRSRAQKPTWVTTQLSDEVIKSAISAPHLKDSMLRRKNEFCELVVV